jgi:excisionase family DNA binding protein
VIPDGGDLQLLTIAELAELWQISHMTIRRRIKTGEIPTVRFGRTVRIPAHVARAVVAQGQCLPADTMASVHSIDRRSDP